VAFTGAGGTGWHADSVSWLWKADGGRPLTSLPHTALNPAPAPAPDPGPTWPELRPGASGESVKTLQYLLRHHGIDVVVDGDFGEQTAAAVAQYRYTHNLKAGIGKASLNEIVTTSTWAALVNGV
jgi:peptidoglycan hydrolase-like protein with peptidoglycan-binding domain